MGPPAKTGQYWYLRSYGRAAVRLLIVVAMTFPFALRASSLLELRIIRAQGHPPAGFSVGVSPAVVRDAVSTHIGFDVWAPVHEQFVTFVASRLEPLLVPMVVLALVAVVLQWYSLRDDPGLRDRPRLR